jgi:hypothetical protein
MRRFLKTVLVASCLASSARAAAGVEFTLSKPHPGYAAAARWIGSLSYFRLSLFPWPGFSEWGMTAMLPLDGRAGAVPIHKADSYVGAYTGHVFPLWRGLVRPGFQVGSTWTEVGKEGGSLKGGFSLYYAFRIQASCLTYIVSNRGQGLGVNFSL